MADITPSEALLQSLDAHPDRLRVVSARELALPAAELLEVDDPRQQMLRLKGWSSRWPRATAMVLQIIGEDLAASLSLAPRAAGMVGRIAPNQPLMGGLEAVLMGALPLLTGPWLDAALERPEVRRAASPEQRHGWTPLRSPPREREWAEGVPFPAVDTMKGAQARLAWLGLDPGTLDGTLSDASLRALHRFQVENFLDPTGELDWATLDAFRLECPDSP